MSIFLEQPSHALLIVGSAGSGKYALARAVALNLLKINQDKLDNYPYFSELSPPAGENEISIDMVRGVISSLKLKTPPNEPVNRVIIIRNAETMSQEAQNALLKILEEPPMGSLFILTAGSPRSVIPTIASRARVITVHEVGLDQANDYYSEQYSHKQLSSAWNLSGGATGLLGALLTKDQQHPLKSAVLEAKQIYSGDCFYRLQVFDGLSKDKIRFGLVVEALARVAESLHHQSAGNNRKQRAMLKNRQLIAQSRVLLTTNTNTRLIALNLALNLRS